MNKPASLAVCPARFYSDSKDLTDPEQKKKDLSKLKVNASPAHLDHSLSSLLSSPKIEYNPNLVQSAKSYSYSAPKTPLELKNELIRDKVKGKTKFQKLLPSILVALLASWAIFTYKYLNSYIDPDADDDPLLLRTDKFLPWVISFKYQIDSDHYLLEVTRKNKSQNLLSTPQKLFDGSQIWSVEIMQPDINITRNYTPLPMYVAGVDPYNHKPILRTINDETGEAKMVLIVKRYPQGEFSKWLTNLQLLDEIKLRGPHIEFKLPWHPLNKFDQRPQMNFNVNQIAPDPKWPIGELPDAENIDYYGAGTGILPLYQMIYSPNPPKGFINVFYSMQSPSEIPDQIKLINFFAEQIGRVKFNYIYGRRLLDTEVNEPSLRNFNGLEDLKMSKEAFKELLKREKRNEIRNQLQSTGDEEDASAPAAEPNATATAPVQSGNILSKIQLTPKDLKDINLDPLEDIKITPKSAYQSSILKRLYRLYKNEPEGEERPFASLAIVCGPVGYMQWLSGKSDLNNLEKVDYGKIGGVLKSKGWDDSNVKRLQ